MSSGLRDRAAYRSSDFDLRPKEFRTYTADVRIDCRLAVFQNLLGRVGDEITGFRINQQVFLFDTNREIVSRIIH